MGKVVAVANQKGGVGKTTTAINLSAALAMRNNRVLVIDLDPQGMATASLGKAKESQKGIYQALMNGHDLMDLVLGTGLDNYYICPCSPELSGAEIELFPKENREKKLREALERARCNFHYIFIDCPPSLGFLTINALSAADSVLIPIQCEFLCMEGIPDLLATFDQVRTYFNPALSIEGIILTMFDERTNLSKQVAAEIRRSLKAIVFEVVIPRSVRLAEAPSFGKPVVLYDIKSRGAEAYLILAQELLSK
ncbi:MAG: chromosome partitioning protein ParA [Candidatus Aminicenantes bacterium RBG_19FT_COMBO_58_17]|jgi:chromosome partitioning protein|nr:MAG: chromosome partitioning protein ParA [Candidatus Aminicenantes bacterium RBG_19FT_COMBO_58_17]HCS49723.1 chromosome partitioning protein ParA [Candidatus Aminicenantes bacterium]